MTPYAEALEQQFRMFRIARDYPDTVHTEPRAWAALSAPLSGPAYYWSPDLCDLLKDAATKLPDVRLQQEMLPSQRGFMWLSKPIGAGYEYVGGSGMPLPKPRELMVAAIGWTLNADLTRIVVAWYGYFADSRVPAFPVGYVTWDFGESQSDSLQALAAMDGAIDGHKIDEREHSAYHFRLSLLGAALLFVNQNVLSARHAEVDRHAAKRLAADGYSHEPSVRVVELRRRVLSGDKRAVESIEREWSCQWWVRAHWRQQYYPSKRLNQPVWIMPHVKGPEDKPRKPPPATLFAVVH